MSHFSRELVYPDPSKNHQKIDLQFIAEIMSKSHNLGSRFEPKSHKNSKKYIPGSSSENHLKKDAQHSQTRPLETMKSSVWFTRNHTFQLSSFAAKCLEKCSQWPLISGTLAIEITKRHPQNTA